MDRPTPEQVDEMLAEYVERDCACGRKHTTPRLDAHCLADEVRALREELADRDARIEQLRSGYDLLHERLAAYDTTHAVLQAAKATIERVEALKPAWRSRSRGLRIVRAERQIGIAEGLRVCSDELEAALRGAG